MSAPKHTPGPWEVNYFVDHDEEGSCIEAAGRNVATLYFRHGKYKAVLAEQSEANAARIVACVNACEGIERPNIVIPELISALRLCISLHETYGMQGMSEERLREKMPDNADAAEQAIRTERGLVSLLALAEGR